MARLRQRTRILKATAHGLRSWREDSLAAEEPLEIRLGHAGGPEVTLSVTMRTPGHDFELVAGFLLSEGIVADPGEIVSLRYCAGEDEDGRQTYNAIQAQLRPDVPLPELTRNVFTSSSCGICGTASIDAVEKTSRHRLEPAEFSLAMLLSLPEKLREQQRLFDSTGGVHAAGLFDASGTALCIREDVGRHNAVDKVLGFALQQCLLPARNTVLQVSGRASFELVQKAAMAGVPALAAVSAPSSLAVSLAQRTGLTLLGFSRGESVNIYTNSHLVNTADM